MSWLYGISIAAGIMSLQWFLAIALAIGMQLLAFPFSTIQTLNTVLAWTSVIAIAAWVVWDSQKIEIKKYKLGIPGNPIVLFICLLGLSGIALSCYLSGRYRIKHGTAGLKEAK